MTTNRFLVASVLALSTLLACTEQKIGGVAGEIGVVWIDPQGQTRTDREATYDFGSVFMGQESTHKIVIRNMGRASLVLESLEKVSGDPLRINNVGEDGAVWSIAFEEGRSLASSEFVELEAKFNPPQREIEQVDHQVVLLLRVQNAKEGEETATITLKGKGISGVCELDKVIDFGNVAVEDLYRRSITIDNPTQLAAIASIGEIQSNSGDHNAFTYAPESPRGEVEIQPNTSIKAEIEFRPTEKRSYLAFVRMRASAQCPEQVVQLTGTGVDSVLSWAPSQVDCGFAMPGTEVRREVTFTNAGNDPAELSAIKTLNNSEFGIVEEQGVDPSRLTVPEKGGTATLNVWCKPLVLGPRQTQLTFSTNLPKQPTGSVLVRAYGGGPDIQVQPHPTMNFGKVAYFPNAQPPVFQKKKLLVINMGTTINPPRNDANLRLGRVDGQGNVIPDTYFTVTPLNPATAPGEFTVTMPQGYDPEKGLEAKAGLNTAELLVTITPTSLGLKQAEISIFSNDPDEAEVKVTVSADATELPPCNYSVTPTTLAFGLISPPDYRDLGFTVKNNGTNPGDICLLSGLDLGPGTHAFFTLPMGPIDNMELEPGASTHVLVRVWPQGTTPTTVTTINGQVDFYMSSPLQPQKTVPLSAQVAPSCLTIAPDELDYGTVQVGCSSATKTFSMYNTCGSPVTVNSFRVLSAPTTDPACLSTAGCEFLLTASPAIPTGGLPINAGSAPTTFQVKYRPQDFGPDTNAVAINATQNGTNVTYVVALKGTGDSQGIHTDVYLQDAKPKADILLVIDNSCSMSDDQQALAANFASFIKYANTAQVDYRMAVTTTDWGAQAGKFVYGPGHPEKVLTPTTVDVENKFKTKVNLGSTGSGYEEGARPALAALTPPLVNSDNTGFLRNDAALAIVFVTDENDQSPQSTTYYLNGFWNLKGFNRKTMFTANAIASFDPSCPAVQDSGEYAFYVAQTNGVKESICTPDWAKALENLGKTAFGFRTNFFLTSAPDLTKGPIDVKIDGVTVPTTDSRGAPIWGFDGIANSVNFEPMYVPEPGQTLTITYHVTCYP